MLSPEGEDGLVVAAEGGAFHDGFVLFLVEEGGLVLPESMEVGEHLDLALEGVADMAVNPFVHVVNDLPRFPVREEPRARQQAAAEHHPLQSGETRQQIVHFLL